MERGKVKADQLDSRSLVDSFCSLESGNPDNLVISWVDFHYSAKRPVSGRCVGFKQKHHVSNGEVWISFIPLLPFLEAIQVFILPARPKELHSLPE